MAACLAAYLSALADTKRRPVYLQSTGVGSLDKRHTRGETGYESLSIVAPATSALTEEDKAARRLLAVVGPAMQDDKKAQ